MLIEQKKPFSERKLFVQKQEGSVQANMSNKLKSS